MIKEIHDAFGNVTYAEMTPEEIAADEAARAFAQPTCDELDARAQAPSELELLRQRVAALEAKLGATVH